MKKLLTVGFLTAGAIAYLANSAYAQPAENPAENAAAVEQVAPLIIGEKAVLEEIVSSPEDILIKLDLVSSDTTPMVAENYFSSKACEKDFSVLSKSYDTFKLSSDSDTPSAAVVEMKGKLESAMDLINNYVEINNLLSAQEKAIYSEGFIKSEKTESLLNSLKYNAVQLSEKYNNNAVKSLVEKAEKLYETYISK